MLKIVIYNLEDNEYIMQHRYRFVILVLVL